LEVMIVSGCGVNKETMATYNEIKDAFQKATFLDSKKCAPIQYATAEAYLAHANHEIAGKDEYYGHLKSPIGITREKSLEAIKICKAPSAPTPPKLVSLSLSTKKYLQDKFNISDNRMIVKDYGSEKAHNGTREGCSKTEGGVQSGSLISDKLKFYYRREVIML
jgi:hypothetical protein